MTTARTYTREFLARPTFKHYVVSTDGIVLAADGDDVLFTVPPHDQIGRHVCDVREPEAAFQFTWAIQKVIHKGRKNPREDSQLPDNW